MGRAVRKRPQQGAAVPPAGGLLTRADLVARWAGHGSASTFRRAERAGRLKPRTDGARVAYAWTDVWACEGGQPPPGREDAYRQPLMTAGAVAALCPLSAEGVLRAARGGELPARQVGRHRLFVPAEVERWLWDRWRYA